jgi:hypothetical protein
MHLLDYANYKGRKLYTVGSQDLIVHSLSGSIHSDGNQFQILLNNE